MEMPSLINFLAHYFLSPIKKRGFFSGEVVVYSNYLDASQRLFEFSCALGFNNRHEIELFAVLFSEGGERKKCY